MARRNVTRHTPGALAERAPSGARREEGGIVAILSVQDIASGRLPRAPDAGVAGHVGSDETPGGGMQLTKVADDIIDATMLRLLGIDHEQLTDSSRGATSA